MCGSAVIRLVPFLRLSIGLRQANVLTPSIFYRARAAHAFAARPPERQCQVYLVVDLDQGIEDHRPAVIAIESS
jgi:hypothetical protein